jgi:hypothetical protein
LPSAEGRVILSQQAASLRAYRLRTRRDAT